jgi:hypothetical protein
MNARQKILTFGERVMSASRRQRFHLGRRFGLPGSTTKTGAGSTGADGGTTAMTGALIITGWEVFACRCSTFTVGGGLVSEWLGTYLAVRPRPVATSTPMIFGHVMIADRGGDTGCVHVFMLYFFS